MCDHPAGLLFAVIVAFLIAFINYYSMGNLKTTVMLVVAVILIYLGFCMWCFAKEDHENEKDNDKN